MINLAPLRVNTLFITSLDRSRKAVLVKESPA